jgi:hypothetical protein
MTLSERISSGDISQEVFEAVAVALGWTEPPSTTSTPLVRPWVRGDVMLWHLPDYLTDIRLTLDEIERRGWWSSHWYIDGVVFFAVHGVPHKFIESERPDRNLTLAAITALLRALGE